MAANNHEHHDVYHVTPFPTYIKVYSALIVLTIITVAAARFDFGVLNTFIAMLIATIKAFAVVWWFMHQKYEGTLNRVIFISGFVFLLLFFGFTAVDIFTRGENFVDIKYGK